MSQVCKTKLSLRRRLRSWGIWALDMAIGMTGMILIGAYSSGITRWIVFFLFAVFWIFDREIAKYLKKKLRR